MTHSLNWLQKRLSQPNPPQIIGFFGDKVDKPNERIFSNFYRSTFEADVEGKTLTFSCSEQYFMYWKALFFKDFAIAKQIEKPNLHPANYKNLGKAVKCYDDRKWGAVRVKFMKQALYHKFTQNTDLRDLLLQTDDAILVETSPYDRIWGIGLGKTPRPGQKPVDWKNTDNWKGQNLLGFALMDIREDIRQELYDKRLR